MQGLHLTADLYRCRCDAAWLADGARLADWCVQAVEAVGLHVSGQAYQQDQGASVALLLGGSHVCVHTWPGEKTVTLDVYVCNSKTEDNSARARGLMFALVNRFQPEWTEQRSLDRGEEA